MVTTSVFPKVHVLVLGLTCVALGPGCGPQHSETLIGPLPPIGARFKVLHGAGPIQSSSQAGGDHKYAFKWSCGTLNFEMVDDSLKVNGKAYEPLKAGDDVVIDGRAEVRVTVNGVQRLPVENPG
jgi:hypothetical protein